MGATGGMAAMGIMGAGNAYNQGQAAKAQADFTSGQYEMNREIAGEEGREAKMTGDLGASKAELSGAQDVAKQRVAGAATGADVNSGSALDLQSDTKWQANQNSIMIKNNAFRQAWGYNTQAIDYGGQSDFAARSGETAASMSYLTSGMTAVSYGTQAYGTYQKYNG